MGKVRVPIYNTPAKSVTLDSAATNGAVLGENLWWPSGALVKASDFAPATQPDDLPVTLWRLLLEIPPNVTALEEATGTGLFAVTGVATGAFREIEPVAGETTIANGDGVAGNPSIGLADVPDAGGGTLQKTVFDAKGRKTGTSAATTDDLPEGLTNLYFTADRVRATVLTGLSLASSAAVTAADTVLSALGKLQAQITALASTVSGLIVQTITNGDTTHAPSGDAVFDALASKADASEFSYGTYTPTITLGTNANAAIPGLVNWMRVGDMVTLSGTFTVSATAAGFTSLEIDLPIASNFSSNPEVGGAGALNQGASAILAALVNCIASTDRLGFSFIAINNASNTGRFSVTYPIVP